MATAKDYEELASLQRGAPERAMLEAQLAIGGGEISWCLEHIGDLNHRMNEYISRPGWFPGGMEKVEKTYRQVRNPRFPKWVEEQGISNAKFDLEHRGTPIEVYVARAAEKLKAYAEAHRALVTYNRAQRLAQEAAVSLAEGRFADTKKALKGLHDHMNSMEEWNRFCREGLPRQPKVIP